MKRNDEDRMIELAFGDLSVDEAAGLHAQAGDDPKLAETLRCYTEMRQGLQALKEVPEMQMSCDRLRDAILAGGLKEPRTPTWTWIGVPAFLAVAAFVVTLAVRKPAIPLPSGDLVASTSGSPLDARIDSAMGPLGAFRFEEPKKAAPAPTTVAKVGGASRDRSSIRSRSQSRVSVQVARVEEDQLDPTKYFKGSASGPSPLAPGAASFDSKREQPTTPIADADSSTLIVIEPEKNIDTGAQKAVEVQSASNVVIGG